MIDHGAAAWNGEMARRWVRNADVMDEALAKVGEALIDLANPQWGDKVLDIGCGAGATTFMAATRTGPDGQALGVDVSAPLVAHARHRAAEKRSSATFAVADAGSWRPDEPADILMSRFGVMFFADPTAAFANMRQCVKPKGRMAFICWRDQKASELFSMAMAAAMPHLKAPPPATHKHAPGPFALSEPGRLSQILCDAGWREVSLRPTDLTLSLPGEGTADQAQRLISLGPVAGLLQAQGVDPAPVVAAVKDKLDRKLETQGHTGLNASVWRVTARA